LELGVTAVFDMSDYEFTISDIGAPSSLYERACTGTKCTYPFLLRTVGYRRQKPGGGFMCKYGIGVLDGLYFIAGWVF
jgi:hypothetical protein